MSEKKPYGAAALVTVLVVIGYFGVYFLAAEYTDVGSNVPLYLVQYRIGPVSLDSYALVFEPARRVDDLLFRRKHGTVLGRGVR